MLKQRVRDHIDPDRDLGHSDKHGKKKITSDEGVDGGATKNAGTETAEGAVVKRNPDGTVCEDCK